MTLSPTAQRLAGLPTLGNVPPSQLEWLAGHGVIRSFADADIVFSQERPDGIIGSPDAPEPGAFVVLSGRLSVRRVERAVVGREVRVLLPGNVSGRLPYSRLTTAAGYIVADGPSEILLVAATDVREMTRECYEFTAFCVHEMLDRARAFKSDDLHREKMTSLGRLSAGLAHELNNPSSAIMGSAREMAVCRREMAAAARALGSAGLSAEQAGRLDALERAVDRPMDTPLSALARADREDAFDGWLADHGISSVPAEVLAATGLTMVDLERAAAGLPADQLGAAMRSVAANVAAARLTTEIENAAKRILSVVTAVKKHTHMDRAPDAEAIDLTQHLTDTITLVQSRARARSVTLTLTIEPGLPPVHGAVGELNQVWLNLIDNAIDAAPDGGHISVLAARERDAVMVRVVDDGAGIPEGNLVRIFDPFFTTKPVGQGEGLGLDIVRTVVGQHRGAVEVDSQPGHTEFRVCLPAAAR